MASVREPAFGLRADQFEYVQLILLAMAVGAFSALGNLGFRELIDFFSWVYRELEWNALGINRGGAFLLLIPLILMSGGVGMLILTLIWPGDVLGYGFPSFLEQVNLGNARVKRRWIIVKSRSRWVPARRSDVKARSRRSAARSAR
jgi:CIC family chloride channel protein